MDSGCRAGERAPGRYRPRRPSESVLYRCVQKHLETWLAQCRDDHDDQWSVPEHVEREFRRYLDCGILARGFSRARCGQCGHDFLIAFSCKGRGVCPSCNARHMVATAAHLTDRALPDLPARQWVLSVPRRLRYFLQRDADLQGAALRLLLRVVEQCLLAHSPRSSSAARLGAVAFIHRFGSSLNAHLHFHGVVIDGVFDAAAAGGGRLPCRQRARCERHRRRAGTGAPAAVARVRAPGPDAARVMKAVRNGIGQMPAFSSLSDQQIEAIARYVEQATGAAK